MSERDTAADVPDWLASAVAHKQCGASTCSANPIPGSRFCRWHSDVRNHAVTGDECAHETCLSTEYVVYDSPDLQAVCVSCQRVHHLRDDEFPLSEQDAELAAI